MLLDDYVRHELHGVGGYSPTRVGGRGRGCHLKFAGHISLRMAHFEKLGNLMMGILISMSVPATQIGIYL